jgi:hypothetical protein
MVGEVRKSQGEQEPRMGRTKKMLEWKGGKTRRLTEDGRRKGKHIPTAPVEW